jgi:hypothetical protein
VILSTTRKQHGSDGRDCQDGTKYGLTTRLEPSFDRGMTLEINPSNIDLGRGGRGVTIEADGESVVLQEDEYPFYYSLLETVETLRNGEKAWMYGLSGSRLLFTVDESDIVCIRHLYSPEEFESEECILSLSTSIEVPLDELAEATRAVCEQAVREGNPEDDRNRRWRRKITEEFEWTF